MLKKSSKVPQTPPLPPLSPESHGNIVQQKCEPSNYVHEQSASSNINRDSKSKKILSPKLFSPIPPPPPPPPPVPPPGGSVPKESENGNTSPSKKSRHKIGDKVSQSKLSIIHERLTKDYMRNWVFEDQRIDSCIEEIEYAVNTLKVVQVDSSINLYIKLIHASVLESDCLESSSLRVVKTLLDMGWGELTKANLQLVVRNIIGEVTNGPPIKFGCMNVRLAIETLYHPICKFSASIAIQIYNIFYDILHESLNKLLAVDIAEGSMENEYNLIDSLISMLRDFVLVPEIRTEKLTGSVLIDLEALLKRYRDKLSIGDSLRFKCCTALSYLVAADEGELPQLKVHYLTFTRPSDNNVDKFIEDALYVVKRLASVKLETHIQYPWRYRYDFRFISNVTPGCSLKKCSSDSQVKIYEAIIEDGMWNKLITDLYVRVQNHLDEHGDESVLTPNIDATLMNVFDGILSVTNGTDIGTSSKSLQANFNHYFPLILDQLKSGRMLKFLQDERFASTCIPSIGECMMTVVHNFTYHLESCIPVMREQGMITVARDLRDKVDDSDFKTTCLLSLAYLIDESDDKKMMQMTDSELTYLISELHKSLLAADASGYQPEELIEGLSRIAVNDDNKLKLTNQGLLPLLVKSLKNPEKYSPRHQIAAANAIWTLAFNEENQKKIMNEKGCMEALNNLKNSEHKEVRGAVAGALWELGGKQKHVQKVGNADASKTEKHIMLSYNHEAQKEVLKINSGLKSLGYRVWIDVERISSGGSTLEAMANAIEQSFLVLIFFSEAYKNSTSCRSEAEYVYEKRKTFIPVQAQAGYKADGWLGMLLGTKYWYSLVKPNIYKSQVDELLIKVKELSSDGADETDLGAAMSPGGTGVPYSSSSVQDFKCAMWTKGQVGEWLDRCNLAAIKEELKDLDGPLLKRLVMMTNDPPTMYSIISRIHGISLANTLRVGIELEKLYLDRH